MTARDVEVERRLSALETNQEALEEKHVNLHKDVHSPEPFSVSSQVRSLKEELARYKHLIVGGVAVLIFLSTYNAISIGKLVAQIKP